MKGGKKGYTRHGKGFAKREGEPGEYKRRRRGVRYGGECNHLVPKRKRGVSLRLFAFKRNVTEVHKARPGHVPQKEMKGLRRNRSEIEKTSQ